MRARSWLLHCPKLKIQELLSKCLQCPPSDVIMLQWKWDVKPRRDEFGFLMKEQETIHVRNCKLLMRKREWFGIRTWTPPIIFLFALLSPGFMLIFPPQGTSKKPLLERWKWWSVFFQGKKKIIKPSISLHPPLIRPSINRVRVKLGHPQQVGNHKTSPTSIKAQRSTRLEKLS